MRTPHVMWVVLSTISLAGGCANRRAAATIGLDHSPYTAKPPYLTGKASPRGQSPRLRPSPIHANTPKVGDSVDPQAAPAPANEQGEDDGVSGDADTADAAPTGGSLTVTIPETVPLLNRVEPPEQPWQPQIIAPIQQPQTPAPPQF